MLCFLPRFALRFIRPDPRSRVTDPVGDIISFIHMFEEKYGRIHPVFYQGTYSQVSVTCQRVDMREMTSGDCTAWYWSLRGKTTSQSPMFCLQTLQQSTGELVNKCIRKQVSASLMMCQACKVGRRSCADCSSTVCRAL